MNHDDLNRRIEAMYKELGHTDGWRFLYSSRNTLARASSTVLLGLNPGGTLGKVAENQRFSYSCEAGSAYTSEVWAEGNPAGESVLQRQIRLLCEVIEVDIEQVLAGNLIPFRSKNWAELRERESSVRFGIEMWTSVLKAVQPNRVFAFGTSQRQHFAAAVGVSPNLQPVRVNWGTVKAYWGRNGSTTLTVLPHLSRYKLLGREHGKSQAIVDWLRRSQSS